MIVPIKPCLEGAAADRFLALARTLAQAQARGRDLDLQSLLRDELAWCQGQLSFDGQGLAYEACARVLLDLVRLGWQVREEGYGIELVGERLRVRGLSPEQIRAEKRITRERFLPALEAQFDHPAVRDFIRRMEQPSRVSGKQSVTRLIAEGPELHARLRAVARDPADSDDPLQQAIQPYLQLVTSDGKDDYTGHSLREIWRYFRYSWSIPYFSTPGRQLLYLIRDAAHPCHAVMGILGLNNCALQMGEDREYHLGWNVKALCERLRAAAKRGTGALAEQFTWLEKQIEEALQDVDPTALVSPDEIAVPTLEVIARLRRRAREFNSLRDETLRELARTRSGSETPVYRAEMGNDLEFGPEPSPVYTCFAA